MDKRSFLKNVGLMSVAMPLNFIHLEQVVASVKHLDVADVASDEDFWMKVRGDYDLKPDYINLENGYYCMMPTATMEHLIEHMRDVNYEASYYMRTVQWENKKKVANKVAEIVGCTADEVAITRNTTESLDLVIGGIQWNAGDEAVMAEQDYGAMLNHFKLMGKRYTASWRRSATTSPSRPTAWW
jgi:selenocysteine lyase/cysteine desulfurase